MKQRIKTVNRVTNETEIYVKVKLDGTGDYKIKTPLPFITHMLEQLSKHSLIDIEIKCKGDTEIDAHHTTEDLGWAIGEAINLALGERKGISRYYSCHVPMDETLTFCSIDVSGRPWLVWNVNLPNIKIGEIDTEVFREFFQAFSQSSKSTIHIQNLYGSNNHHIVESCFKSLALCLQNSILINERNQNRVPSTKGSLD